MPDPNAPWTDKSRTYLLIIPDEPQTMGLVPGDSGADPYLYEGTVEYIRLDDAYAGYAGEHHIVSIDPWKTYWPTDTGLPLGAPTTRDLHILD